MFIVEQLFALRAKRDIAIISVTCPYIRQALIFAFLDAFQLQMQGLGVKLPYQIFLALPYVFAILALALSRSRSQAPAALGAAYSRE